MLQELLITLGIITLYVCFSAGLGLAIHASLNHSRGGWLLATAYAMVLYLPASIFVLRFPVPPLPLRITILSIGIFVAVVSAIQPKWVPTHMWEQPYRGGALTLAMGLAAIWGVSFAYASGSSTTLLLVLATLSAALASLRTTFEPHNP